eukprot:431905_1
METHNALLSATNTNKRTRQCTIALIISIVLVVSLSIFLIVYSVEVVNKKQSGDRVCDTMECIAISEELSFYMNKSASPCDDWYSYACGGWQEKKTHELIKERSWFTSPPPGESQYNTQIEATILRDNVVLSVLYSESNENAELRSHPSVQSMREFYDSCKESTVSMEDIQNNELLNEFIDTMTFSTDFTNISSINATWSDINVFGFQTSLSWLFKRRWNLFFYLDVYTQYTPLFMQNYQIWANYNHSQWMNIMDKTFVPLFQSLFSLSETDSILISNLVLDFMNNMSVITTSNSSYFDFSSRMNYERQTGLLNISNILGDSTILNYSNLISETFDISTDVSDVVSTFIYLTPGVNYFNSLIALIESTPPIVIQYFLFSSVMHYFMDFQQTYTQNNRFIERREFCMDLLRTNYGYIFSHIIYDKLYSKEKHEYATRIVDYIKDYGLVPLIENADWMDEQSKDAALKKANFMRFFIGIPDNMQNISLLDLFYKPLTMNINESSHHGFVTNYGYVFDFNIQIRLQRFYAERNEIDPGAPWPEYFSMQGNEYRTDAFYSRSGNWFCITHPRLNKPVFSVEYPSYLNFGGIGFIMGHEFSHGFDAGGVLYDFNGTRNRIFTNETQQNYDEKTQCFVNLYDNFMVQDFYLNGTNSITENVADQAGMQEAHLGWLQYRKDYPEPDKIIGFENFNGYQLFWLGFARNRCDVWTDNFYRIMIRTPGYYWTHSPGIARITAVAQHRKAFSDAWKCDAGSYMNPEHTCILW